MWRIPVSIAIALSASGAPVQAAVYEIQADGSLIDRETIPSAQSRRSTSRAGERAHATGPAPGLHATFASSATEFELSTELIEAVAWADSRFQPGARSPVGATGIMQLMPATARQLGIDAHDLRQNIMGGTSYLRRLLDRYDGDIVKALAAYNAGPGAVDRRGGTPPFPETQRYVASILDRLSRASTTEKARP